MTKLLNIPVFEYHSGYSKQKNKRIRPKIGLQAATAGPRTPLRVLVAHVGIEGTACRLWERVRFTLLATY